MRAVLHQDIVSLATSLLAQPTAERSAFAALQLKLTDAADRYRKRFGKAHALYGNGTLSSCCAKMPKELERRLDDAEYAECLIKALEAVVAFRSGEAQPDQQL